MPNSTITSFAKKSGKSEAEVEKLWKKAEGIVQDEHPDLTKDDDKYYQILVGV